MQIDIDVMIQLAFGAVALYLLWDRQALLARVMHLEEMHNKLCDSVEYFSTVVEDEVDKLYETMEEHRNE